MSTSAFTSAKGSSPLTRGKPGRRTCAPTRRRLIPAHAGKTQPCASEPSNQKAHPRSRGENACCPPGRVQKTGSSPLTRGKPVSIDEMRGVRGLIPAHAGKTPRRLAAARSRSAHPRSRGENSYATKPTTERIGSSPLTRGKPRDHAEVGHEGRLIPAHAGKTPRHHARVPMRRAHPRSRGENVHAVPPNRREDGSSPLTRGKLTHTRSRLTSMRLIPAHAGKTWAERSSS